MQRSRKVLLQRRAALENAISGRKRMYKVSLSLVLFLWGLILLLNSLVSNGNSYQSEFGAVVGESAWHEVGHESQHGQGSNNFLASGTINSNVNDQNANILDSEMVGSGNEFLVKEKNEQNVSPISNEYVAEESSYLGIKAEQEAPIKSERLSRVPPPRLDEFKSRTITANDKPITGQAGTVIHRVETGGKEYNYAAATKGAKVLAFNKEAKGASNILDKDKDKYLRNPCSADEKFVIIELSEETLVDAFEIANLEHYSSNLKDFELLSSLVYPTDSWVELGNFTYGNVKHVQRFTLEEPKWTRYLKLRLLSHYGSEFYCTLSVLEVYGVDAVETMLEDLISDQNKLFGSEENNAEQQPVPVPSEEDDLFREFLTQMDNESGKESVDAKGEVQKSGGPDPSGVETRPPPVGRMPGDTVLKILMQKVRLLDVNFSVLERYLEELNTRYGQIFKDFDNEIADKDLLLEKIRLQIKNFQNSNDVFDKDIADLFSWKAFVSSQLDKLASDNVLLRLEIEKVHDYQADMENRALVVIFLSFIFGCLAAIKLFTDMLMSTCRIRKSEENCRSSSAWVFLLLSSSIVALILVL